MFLRKVMQFAESTVGVSNVLLFAGSKDLEHLDRKCSRLFCEF